MYNDLQQSSSGKHTQLLKTVNDKALVELTISNTFMNTQNNENIEKTQEDMEQANNPENERKMMIE